MSDNAPPFSQPTPADRIALAGAAINKALADHGVVIVPSLGVKPIGTPVQGHLSEMMVVAGWALVVVD